MKILTCMKHVPTSAATPRITADRTGIEEQGLSYEVNEPDLYAIEEALYQRSIHAGSVTSVTLGPARAKEALHIAHAKGVDHAVHIVDEKSRGTQTGLAVRAIAQFVKRSSFDLIFAGIQADDDLQGLFGVALGEELGLPVITAVTEVRAAPAQKKLTAVRELGGGYKQEIEVDMPCVLTIQFGIRALRYVPVMAVVRARAKKIETIDVETLGVTAGQTAPGLRMLELAAPKDSGRCEFIDGPVRAMTDALVQKLIKAGVLDMARTDVLLVCEAGKGQTESGNARLVETGRALAAAWGGTVCALLAGHGISAKAEELSRYVDCVYLADSPQYAQYTGQEHLHALRTLVDELNPGAVLFAHSYIGMDLAPRLAVKLGAGMASNCMELEATPEGVSVLRPMYRGRLHARLAIESRPVIATLQASGVKPAPREAAGRVTRLDAGNPADSRMRAVKTLEPERSGVDITAADIVVSGGRGIGTKENYALVSELAEALGGISACSRPLVDMGWFDTSRQVGLSGNTVKPKLYVACGISGAMEHLHGMKESGIIVAINQDPGAPIFKVAHFGLVGDLNEITPQLTACVKAARANSGRG